VPAGSLLYLEAKDFSSLLGDWNSSPQKRQWLQSDNYEVFSRSRLFLRLKGASDQFAAAAGLPPDMNFLSRFPANTAFSPSTTSATCSFCTSLIFRRPSRMETDVVANACEV
jgi:hypothetical protein